jgi:hypothetical protein
MIVCVRVEWKSFGPEAQSGESESSEPTVLDDSSQRMGGLNRFVQYLNDLSTLIIWQNGNKNYRMHTVDKGTNIFTIVSLYSKYCTVLIRNNYI